MLQQVFPLREEAIVFSYMGKSGEKLGASLLNDFNICFAIALLHKNLKNNESKNGKLDNPFVHKWMVVVTKSILVGYLENIMEWT